MWIYVARKSGWGWGRVSRCKSGRMIFALLCLINKEGWKSGSFRNHKQISVSLYVEQCACPTERYYSFRRGTNAELRRKEAWADKFGYSWIVILESTWKSKVAPRCFSSQINADKNADIADEWNSVLSISAFYVGVLGTGFFRSKNRKFFMKNAKCRSCDINLPDEGKEEASCPNCKKPPNPEPDPVSEPESRSVGFGTEVERTPKPRRQGWC